MGNGLSVVSGAAFDPIHIKLISVLLIKGENTRWLSCSSPSILTKTNPLKPSWLGSLKTLEATLPAASIEPDKIQGLEVCGFGMILITIYLKYWPWLVCITPKKGGGGEANLFLALKMFTRSFCSIIALPFIVLSGTR